VNSFSGIIARLRGDECILNRQMAASNVRDTYIIYWLFVEFVCVKVVGATSSEGFLVYKALSPMSVN